jgi:acyl-CoA synthetase (AMP-forming)/AMP-acid ligase II
VDEPAVPAPLLVGDIFRNAARATPERVAVWHRGRSATFGAVDRASDAVAHELRSRGVGHGARVAVWSDTSVDVVPVFAALAKLGAVFVPVSPLLAPTEAAGVFDAARADLVVAEGTRDVGSRAVVALDELPVGDPTRAPEPVVEPALRETDAHVVFFTSGSTGRPKGAVLSHRVNVLRSHPGALLEPRGAMVCPFPLFHMGAWTIALQQWQARDAVVFTAADPVEILDAIERHRATRAHCLPGVWRRILDELARPGAPARDLSSVRLADAATTATPVELLTAIERALPNAGVRVFYGSTEAGTVTSLGPEDVRRKPGSVGVVAPLTEVRVVDGELCARGPLLFSGYLDDPDTTAHALRDGWYHTGDVVEVDDEGYVRIVGRVGEIIRTGGEVVAPPEVEAVLATHPAVADVAVVGLPDPHWGETVCAVVVVPPGVAAPGLDDLRAHAEPVLARFKLPRRVEVVDAIPRTPATQQIRRRELLERFGAASA